MTLVTFVTPVASYHEALIDRVTECVKAQSVTCEHLIVKDSEARGAGWARNQGLADVRTPYVVFLDADDTVAPTFAERCMQVRKRGNYVYTDMRHGEQVVHTRDCTLWFNGSWHAVTTLLPTAWARFVGGFNEHLPGAEDTDFYTRLLIAGFCGQRLPEVLFEYSADGQRSRRMIEAGEHHQVLRRFQTQYAGRMFNMGCCGDDSAAPLSAGERQEGDVLVQAMWHGNRIERGRVTGRHYRGGWQKQLWVNEADADAMPELFQRVIERLPLADPFDAPSLPSQSVGTWVAVTEQAHEPELVQLATSIGLPAPTPKPVRRAEAVKSTADVKRVMTRAKRGQARAGRHE